MKRIQVGGKMIGRADQPLICSSLVGKSRVAILDEVDSIVPKRPDLIEWRVDFFEALSDIAEVIDLVSAIKTAVAKIPVIFSFRTMSEGGGVCALNESDILKLYVAACASRCVDFIDYEMSNSLASVTLLREISRNSGVAMIMSYHDHQGTPDDEILEEKFAEAERLGADVAKVVVTPRHSNDVLSLLSATQKASKKRAIPLISVAVGGIGAVSRVFGWAYGSSVTFASGRSKPVPGQMRIEELRSVLTSVSHALRGG
ncbi:3-dehydroquinate dehydratase [Betaproteobacteria bacterium]|nr:3-dehydroquinate dehydratase [Betaproteobacteria bacterium]